MKGNAEAMKNHSARLQTAARLQRLLRSMALALVLSLALALVLTGCGGGEADYDPLEGVETVTFTDDCGREVEIPETITKAAPSGSVAQMVLMTIAPETLVGLAASPSTEQLDYFPEYTWKLPTFGQFYGSKANLNMEALIAAQPQGAMP